MSTHVTLNNGGTSFNIVPVRLSLQARQHLTRAYDGTMQLTSFANTTYGYDSLVMTFYWSSLTAANFIQCQVWSSSGTQITVTDSDTASEYSVYTGVLMPPNTPNSVQKNPQSQPSLVLMLDSVTQR